MKISTKGRYALRVMIDIAIHSNGRCVSIKEIAGRQEISEKYLEQIFTVLSRSGLLRSTRGAQGGYTLTRDPEDYTVGMILRALEGDLAPVDCVAQGQSGSGPCRVRSSASHGRFGRRFAMRLTVWWIILRSRSLCGAIVISWNCSRKEQLQHERFSKTLRLCR